MKEHLAIRLYRYYKSHTPGLPDWHDLEDKDQTIWFSLAKYARECAEEALISETRQNIRQDLSRM